MSEDDAEDVVQLLHESLLDAFTTDTGEVDFGRKGGMSLAKQVKECGMCGMCMDYVGCALYTESRLILLFVQDCVGIYVPKYLCM